MKNFFNKQTPLEKEWLKLEKQEQEFKEKRLNKRESKLDKLLEEKVPPKLQDTLDKVFEKAFQTVLEKGTTVVEKHIIKMKKRLL